jgi:hypothetical protein
MMNDQIEYWSRNIVKNAALPEVWRSVGELSETERNSLLAEAIKLQGELSLATDLLPEAGRIVFVKLVLALLPKSVALVEDIVFSKDINNQELQFTLWCYLEEIWDDQELAAQHENYAIDLLKRYLLSEPGDEALQEWMALDLIFEHLPREIRERIIQDVLASKNVSENLKSALISRSAPASARSDERQPASGGSNPDTPLRRGMS